jgi:hypothetical protein
MRTHAYMHVRDLSSANGGFELLPVFYHFAIGHPFILPICTYTFDRLIAFPQLTSPSQCSFETRNISTYPPLFLFPFRLLTRSSH